jgi:hypothetical protein
MAARRFGGRTLATLALGSLGLAAGCYSATPHRAEIASSNTPVRCASVVADVFARSGFIQLPSPPKVSMLFGARTSGPYSSFLTTGSGVGVTLTGDNGGSSCHVTIEALSPDVACHDAHTPLTCGGGAMDVITGEKIASSGNWSGTPPCPEIGQTMCELSNAPGAENDSAVDELARRVQMALGPAATVN